MHLLIHDLVLLLLAANFCIEKTPAIRKLLTKWWKKHEKAVKKAVKKPKGVSK